MTVIEFRTAPMCDVENTFGDDDTPCRTAKVSTFTDDLPADFDTRRFLSFLIRNGHGSPFEHAAMTFRLEIPVYVARQLMRHRIASYNEASARYTTLKPVFYLPGPERMLVQRGTHASCGWQAGSSELREDVRHILRNSAEDAWDSYEWMLEAGVAREVARAVLPLNVGTELYVTMNLRALSNFLHLRTDAHAQYEIRQVADMMEAHFGAHFPVIHDLWAENGRKPL